MKRLHNTRWHGVMKYDGVFFIMITTIFEFNNYYCCCWTEIYNLRYSQHQRQAI